MSLEALYYDGITVLLLLLSFYIFYKKGFLSSAMQLVSLVAALYIAFFVTSNFGPKIYEMYIYPRILAAVTAKVSAFYAGVESGSGMLGKLISGYLVSSDGSLDPAQQAQVIIEKNIEKIALTAVKVVLFAVAFLVVYILLKILTKLLKNVNDVPFIGKINEILGGAFGLLVGIAVIIVAGAILNLLMGSFTNDWLNEEVIAQTKIFSFFYNNNPLIG